MKFGRVNVALTKLNRVEKSFMYTNGDFSAVRCLQLHCSSEDVPHLCIRIVTMWTTAAYRVEQEASTRC